MAAKTPSTIEKKETKTKIKESLVKILVAEIDKIAEYIEDLGEPWTFQIVWRLDKVAQELDKN